MRCAKRHKGQRCRNYTAHGFRFCRRNDCGTQWENLPAWKKNGGEEE